MVEVLFVTVVIVEFWIVCELFWFDDVLGLGLGIWVPVVVSVLLEFSEELLIEVAFKLEEFCFYWFKGTKGGKLELEVYIFVMVVLLVDTPLPDVGVEADDPLFVWFTGAIFAERFYDPLLNTSSLALGCLFMLSEILLWTELLFAFVDPDELVRFVAV